MEQFENLNPEKASVVDGANSAEPWAKEEAGEHMVLKPTWDAFFGTDLHDYLQERRIEHCLCAGLITSVCVQHTAHGAFSRGYAVSIVPDCCGDRSVDRHRAALELYGNYMYHLIWSTDITEFLGEERSRLHSVAGSSGSTPHARRAPPKVHAPRL